MTPLTQNSEKTGLIFKVGIGVWDVDFEVLMCPASSAFVVRIERGLRQVTPDA